MPDDTYVIGDVHGHAEALSRLLTESGIVGNDGRWDAGNANVWFIGDLVDRGPDGIGALEIVMRLQQQAAAAGGRVGCLLGNHEVYLLAAYRLGGKFVLHWIQCGGTLPDLERLRPEHADWLETLPCLVAVGDVLLAHADATFYLDYGSTIDAVNDAIGWVLQTRDPDAWAPLMNAFAERHAFEERKDKGTKAQRFLKTFGCERMIHGHTPIFAVRRCKAEEVTEPFVYAGGLCTNVDGCLYAGGRGFVTRL